MWSALAIISLIVFWIFVVLIINPVGDFMVNDDWAFTRTFETLLHEGRLASTGWGPAHAPGGPALIAQLIWTLPFALIAGPSPTVLRIAVLSLAGLGTFGLFALLRLLKAPPPFALFGTFVFILNPLFLSQSFSFMTDVPFVLFICLSLQKARFSLILVGLLFGLCATLTRQIGLIVPVGLIIATVIHPKGIEELGRLKILIATVCIGLIPWIAFEFYLAISGSTPLSEHAVIHKIFLDPTSRSFFEYFVLLIRRFVSALIYCSFFVFPILLMFSPVFGAGSQKLRLFLWLSFLVFVLLELALITGLLQLPVIFYQNVIFNFGIGPILLKDTYVLGISRTWTLPTPLFYAFVYIACIATVVVIQRLILSINKFLRHHLTAYGPSMDLFSLFTVIAILLYTTAIVFTGFHDRYLIPVCLLLTIWIFADTDRWDNMRVPLGRSFLSIGFLVIIGIFSVLGLHDFMAFKRSLAQADKYLVHKLGANPCNIDGGFEFNGYHCYQNNFKSKKGLSWWWVNREDYLVTLGPLTGYKVLKVFPFQRWMGPQGGVHILYPLSKNPC